MKSTLLVLLLAAAAGRLSGQAEVVGWTEAEENERLNYGLKLGTGMSAITGGELQRPRPMVSFLAGAYYYTKEMKKSPLAFQTGLDARFRGGNFGNSDSGNTAYTRIGLVTLDMPLLLNYRLGKKQEDKYRCIQIGAQIGYILKSVAYTGSWPNYTPADADNYMSRWKNLPLHPFDIQAVAGYQYRGGVMGWTASVKVGLNNLNDNFKMPNLTPATGNGKRIATVSFDLGLVF
ncbi:MAG: outer membrane beta-barrel protein [Bacteroidetes bacterium]|nr:outer membrane beta-barrel protein [Bacteroidota bacterium]